MCFAQVNSFHFLLQPCEASITFITEEGAVCRSLITSTKLHAP